MVVIKQNNRAMLVTQKQPVTGIPESRKGYRGPKLKTEVAYDNLVGVKLG